MSRRIICCNKHLRGTVISATTLLCCFFQVAPTCADRIVLTGERSWEGRILSEDADAVVIQTVGGPVRVSRTEIKSIEKSKTREELYAERADALAKDDLTGHYLLGLWCEKQGLSKEARYHLFYVIGLDPDHEGARKALGFARYGDKWMTEEEANKAKGLTLYKGHWMTADAVQAARDAEAASVRKTSLAKDVQKLARRIADSADYRDRVEAEKTLWRMHDPLAYPAIVALLDSPDAQVRIAALKAIKKLDIRSTSGRLARTALFDTEEEARGRASELLVVQFNPDVRRILMGALQHPDKQVRASAARILGAVGDPSTVQALIDGLYLTYHFKPGEAAPVIGTIVHPDRPAPARVVPLDQPADSPDVFVINYDALDALKAITGQDFGTSKRNWHEWWAENEDQFTVWSRKVKQEGTK